MKLLLLPVLCAAAILSASCKLAPAGIERIKANRIHSEPHELLDEFLSDPESPVGKLALGRFVESWRRGNLGPRGEVRHRNGAVSLVRFEARTAGSYRLDYFDTLTPASEVRVRGIDRHQRLGAGVPMMAMRENRRATSIESFYPPEGIARAVTAVATVGKKVAGKRQVSIALLSPDAHSSVTTHGENRTLAGDFSVSWAAMLARTGVLNQRGLLDMLNPAPVREPGLYLMEPYDRQKEPVIMIHGLLSTPLAWAGLTNDLWADQAIRDRYQIWHYHYNTSAPALYSSRILRAWLRDLREVVDPERDDPAMRRMTLLTHSMGGLVGQALAKEPGDVFWKAAFTVPPAALKLAAEDRRTLRDAFEWKAEAAIHRIIFVATPHRGSDFADNPIGRIGSWLVTPPSGFGTLYDRISRDNPGAFTPAYAALGSGTLDAVASLSPRQPSLRILSELPYAHPVKLHSIIGDRGKKGPPASSSDGIVPYSSSHLKNANSELIVPSGHGAFRHPAAIAEILRILKSKT